MRLFPSTVVSNSECPMMFGPNIIGAFANYGLKEIGEGTASGSFAMEAFTSKTEQATLVTKNTAPKISFDSSRSSSLYGASDIVQPASLRYLACIKV